MARSRWFYISTIFAITLKPLRKHGNNVTAKCIGVDDKNHVRMIQQGRTSDSLATGCRFFAPCLTLSQRDPWEPTPH